MISRYTKAQFCPVTGIWDKSVIQIRQELTRPQPLPDNRLERGQAHGHQQSCWHALRQRHPLQRWRTFLKNSLRWENCRKYDRHTSHHPLHEQERCSKLPLGSGQAGRAGGRRPCCIPGPDLIQLANGHSEFSGSDMELPNSVVRPSTRSSRRAYSSAFSIEIAAWEESTFNTSSRSEVKAPVIRLFSR